jgi:hypothetical protein
MDAVCGPDNWGEVRIEHGGILQARLLYSIQRKYGFRVLGVPPLTQTLGPWFADTGAKLSGCLSREKELGYELIDRLPPHDLFEQSFHRSIVNWLPWYWRDFEQTTCYTYRLDDLSDLEEIWKGCSENIRRDIRKAERRYSLQVRTDLDVEAFLDLDEMTFNRQGMKLPYSRDLIYRLDAACVKHDRRRIFFAQAPDGALHAAVYLVWDDNSAYYLMGGSDPTLRNSGAGSLVMWSAIQYAAKVSRSFDFEGSMIEPIERFFRSFGARQIPYFQVRRFNSRSIKVLWHLKRALRGLVRD